jgi:porin
MWYQQKFLEGEKLEVRVGQQSLDQEFMVSENGSLFINSMMGWPMLPSADLPAGSPAYPLSALGIRVRARLASALELLAGVYNGSPAASSVGDPQKEDRYGTSFPLNGGVLAIAELQYTYPSFGALVDPSGAAPLARVYKLGFWYDSESFPDEEFDTNGLSLANPSSNGMPRMHHGDYSVYGVIDQMVWQSDEAASRTLNIFAKPMGTLAADRNLIEFSAVAGLTLHEPIAQRDDDTFGIGLGYTRVSSQAAGLDRDVGRFTDSAYPVRGGETFWEVTYQFQVAPWWQLQPDFQYFINPGGGVLNPDAPGHKIGNEAVIGLRTNIQF